MAIIPTTEPTDAGAGSWARLTGVIYLAFFVASGLNEGFLRQAGISAVSPVIDGPAVVPALSAHFDAFRIGFAFGLVAIGLYVGLMVCSTASSAPSSPRSRECRCCLASSRSRSKPPPLSFSSRRSV